MLVVIRVPLENIVVLIHLIVNLVLLIHIRRYMNQNLARHVQLVSIIQVLEPHQHLNVHLVHQVKLQMVPVVHVRRALKVKLQFQVVCV
jgi:hypothetical protein